MSLTPELRERIASIIDSGPVVVFMKGTREQPQCGFSARVVQILDRVLPEYRSFDVLSDTEVREGIKAYSDWPTIPQLYISGEFQGGCDIISEMYNSGDLHRALGLERPEPRDVSVTITDPAAEILRAAMQRQPGDLHLGVDTRFRHSLVFGPAAGDEITVEANGIRVLLDRDSAARAEGVVIDAEPTPAGPRLKIDNPKAAAAS